MDQEHTSRHRTILPTTLLHRADRKESPAHVRAHVLVCEVLRLLTCGICGKSSPTYKKYKTMKCATDSGRLYCRWLSPSCKCCPFWPLNCSGRMSPRGGGKFTTRKRALARWKMMLGCFLKHFTDSALVTVFSGFSGFTGWWKINSRAALKGFY